MDRVEPFRIAPFERRWASAVRALAEDVLCREHKVQPDLSAEEDLVDVSSSYAPPDSLFLVGIAGDAVVATAGVRRLSETDCELTRLYVHASRRRQGLASSLVATILPFARSRGYRRMLLEIRPEMRSTLHRYGRYGFAPLDAAAKAPRSGRFLSMPLGGGAPAADR